MISTLKKKLNKKGFTLAELLIVIAIIAILVAIAIPVFSTQLNKAEERVEMANKRTASSMAIADYLLDGKTNAETYYYIIDDEFNLTSASSKPSSGPYIEVKVAAGGSIDSSTYVK